MTTQMFYVKELQPDDRWVEVLCKKSKTGKVYRFVGYTEEGTQHWILFKNWSADMPMEHLRYRNKPEYFRQEFLEKYRAERDKK